MSGDGQSEDVRWQRQGIGDLLLQLDQHQPRNTSPGIKTSLVDTIAAFRPRRENLDDEVWGTGQSVTVIGVAKAVGGDVDKIGLVDRLLREDDVEGSEEIFAEVVGTNVSGELPSKF